MAEPQHPAVPFEHHLLCDALEQIMQRFRDDAGEWSEEHEDMRKALKTLLARLAREKTSAERERDGANRVVAEAGLRLRGAEQEAARLRADLAEIWEIASAFPAAAHAEAVKIERIAERALAAAAGAEEPR